MDDNSSESPEWHARGAHEALNKLVTHPIEVKIVLGKLDHEKSDDVNWTVWKGASLTMAAPANTTGARSGPIVPS